MDDSYKLALEFMNNLSEKHAGFGNIYVIKRYDKDKNLLDVKFCKNLMTDYGFEQFFMNESDFPTNMYVGYGSIDIPITHVTKTMNNVLTDNTPTAKAGVDYAYPLYYDNISGLITTICRFKQFEFSESFGNFTYDVAINEYGIGTNSNNLWTHSWVYDNRGGYSYIVKRPAEILIVDVFFCMTYYESLITTNWMNGRYMLITTLNKFVNRLKGTIHTYKRNGLYVTRDSNTTLSRIINNTLTRNINVNQIVITSAVDDSNGYIDGFVDWTSGFMIAERELLPNPESYDIIVNPKDANEYSFSDRFGEQDTNGINMTQAVVNNMYMYNYDTNAYDISVPFLNDQNKWYNETLMQISYPTPIYYSNNDTIITAYVYQNINTHDAITAFDVNLQTVYACEKYWDKTTWHFISNLSIVPSSDTNQYGHTMNCQIARYYITTSKTISLVPHRTLKGLIINPSEGGCQKLNLPLTDETGYAETCDNYEYHWYKWGNRVYCPNANTRYTLGDTSNITMTYGKWMMIFQSENNIARYADMSNLSSQPTLNSINLTFGGDVNLYNGTYKSQSETGLISVQATSKNVSYVFDLTGNSIISTRYDTYRMCTIWGTDKIAYIETSDSTHIKIYEFGDVNSVVQTLDLPITYSNIKILFGHTNYLWIVATSTDSYCYNIITGEMSMVSTPFTNIRSKNAYDFKVSCVDDFLIVYVCTLTNTTNAYYIKLTEPLYVNAMTQISDGGKNRSTIELRKLNNSSVALIYMSNGNNSNSYGSKTAIVDFGKYITDMSNTFQFTDPDYNSTVYGYNNIQFIPYGKYFIRRINELVPIEQCIPHRITGTTRTIGAMNAIKSLTNKTFTIEFTNIPEFEGGLPPGSQS